MENLSDNTSIEKKDDEILPPPAQVEVEEEEGPRGNTSEILLPEKLGLHPDYELITKGEVNSSISATIKHKDKLVFRIVSDKPNVINALLIQFAQIYH